MKEFMKTFAVCLILIILLFFFGGPMLFDLRRHYYLTAAAIAFLLAIPVSLYHRQREKLEELESRVRDLEDREGQ